MSRSRIHILASELILVVPKYPRQHLILISARFLAFLKLISLVLYNQNQANTNQNKARNLAFFAIFPDFLGEIWLKLIMKSKLPLIYTTCILLQYS